MATQPKPAKQAGASPWRVTAEFFSGKFRDLKASFTQLEGRVSTLEGPPDLDQIRKDLAEGWEAGQK